MASVTYGSGAHEHMRGGLVGWYERKKEYRDRSKGAGPSARVARMVYDQMTNKQRKKDGLPPKDVRPL
jgi:hypothetical protein